MKKLFIYIAVSLFIVISHYLIYKSDFVKLTDYKIYDFISSNVFQNETKERQSHVVVVDIDESSLRALGQWPWPRVVLADLIAKVDKLHASAIGVDIIFSEKDRTSPIEIAKFYQNFFGINNLFHEIPNALFNNDAILSEVLKKSQAIMSLYLSNEYLPSTGCGVLESMEIDKDKLILQEYKYALCNVKDLQLSDTYQGFVNSVIDNDGILRRVSLFKEYQEKIIPNFSLAILLSMGKDFYQEGAKKFNIFDTEIKTNQKSEVLLNIYDELWYKKVSAIDIINEKVSTSLISGKIVIIGSSSVGLHDQVIVKGGRKIIGSKIHVTTIDNILNNEYFRELSILKIVNILLSTLATFVLFFLLITQKNGLIVFLSLSVISIAILTSYYFIYNGEYISIAYFLLPFLIHFFIVSFLYIFIDAYEKHKFVKELNESHIALLDSMVHVAEVHDIETGAHIIRTKKYIKVLATHIYNKGIYEKELSLERIDMMYATAPLHDIGKVGIEDTILKKKGKLTPLEYEVMKTHSDLGRHIINNAISSYKENKFFIMARNIAHYHHEKWDGSGYPEGLKGEEIPIESRLMALADVYDALVTKRVYKKAFSFEQTNEIILEGKGKHFDPVLVEGFFEIEKEFRDIAQKHSDSIQI